MIIEKLADRKETLERMLKLVSSKTGVVNHVSTYKGSKHDRYLGNILPLYYSYACIGSQSTEHEVDNGLQGGGISMSKTRSIIKAIGECIERYCAFLESDANLDLYANVEHLKVNKINYVEPHSLVYFSDDQYNLPDFPFEKYLRSDYLYWEKGYNLTKNSETFIPAQKVYLYYKRLYDEKIMDISVSTGLACGDSFYDAVLSGIYERVERDAFNLTWLCKIPGRRIVVDEIDNRELKDLYSLICANILDDLYIIDISIDTNIYTILTLLINKHTGSIGAAVACASNLNPEVALFKSLEELMQTYKFSYSLMYKEWDGEYEDINRIDIAELEDHVRYYFNPQKNRNMNFLINNEACVNLSALKNYSSKSSYSDLSFCIKCLEKIGIDIIAVDIIKKEIEDAGLKVVKVLTPGLMDLDVLYSARNLGCKRLENIINKYNLKVNQEPHPFP